MTARSGFFDGVYVKHSARGHTLALIPAVHVDQAGTASASIQVVTEREAWSVPVAAHSFVRTKTGFFVAAGDSFFSREGCVLHVRGEGLALDGALRYGPFTPPQGDVMGPLRHAPLVCRHSVESLFHTVRGAVTLNGRRISFDGGTGYIEGDRGASFPERYLWAQANFQKGGAPACVVAAAARLKLAGCGFDGTLACVLFNGREERIATYRGARVAAMEEGYLAVRQGALFLEAVLLDGVPLDLKAPEDGSMRRVIREYARARVRFRLREGGTVLLNHTDGGAGFEYDEAQQHA